VTAVGIGIAGASVEHSHDWLRETLSPVLPGAVLALSSDYEIALLGALGQRDGILILAGTGSAAYAHAPDGRSARIGGWGYVLGDEGSGYWIGLQALKHLTHRVDQSGWQFELESLAGYVARTLKISSASQLLQWIYDSSQVPVQEIAVLAEIVIERAESADPDAGRLLESAAQALCQRVDDLRSKLNAPELPVAFAGGLLSADNALSRELCRQLDQPQRPIARYTPVLGAALLAQLGWKESPSHEHSDCTSQPQQRGY
jgi:N-acetylglucosamine kinase-like BadF-type ATPase